MLHHLALSTSSFFENSVHHFCCVVSVALHGSNPHPPPKKKAKICLISAVPIYSSLNCLWPIANIFQCMRNLCGKTLLICNQAIQNTIQFEARHSLALNIGFFVLNVVNSKFG
jgi:hypothetical protein